jgi:hypothetical protein
MPSGAIGQESPKWFGMRLATGHITNIETQIEEPSTLMDSWIGFHLEHPSLMGVMPQKLLYSLISRTSVLLSLKQCNIWIKGPIYETMPRERMDNLVT